MTGWVKMQFAAARQAAFWKYTNEIQAGIQKISGRGEALREGLRLAIARPPNAGKSSLLNALARRDVAIVSDIPGTTCDVIDVRLDFGGYPVHVADTAGLRASFDAIEPKGVRRARAEAAASHLTLLLLDGSDPAAQIPHDIAPDLTAWNKSDLPGFKQRDGIGLSLKKR